MSKQNVTAAIAAKAVKAAGAHVSGADAAYLDKVQFVVAHKAAELGAKSGDILLDTVATLVVASQWDIKWTAAMSAYCEAGGSEGTFRVATTRAGLLDKPKGKVNGIHAYRKSVAEAILSDSPSEQIARVRIAVETLKGAMSWRKFHDTLADKLQSDKPERTQKTADETVNAAVAAYKAGIDPETGAHDRAVAKAAENAINSDGSGDICNRISSFFEHASQEQVDRVMTALSAVGLGKVNAALTARAPAETAKAA